MKRIDRDAAWRKFLEIAEEDWRAFATPGQDLHIDESLHHNGFWMFFRNPDVVIPARHALSFDVSVVIREDGKVFNTPNFYPNLEMCERALKKISILQKINGNG